MSGKVNLDRWLPHLRAAEREGKAVAAYAREHGLSRYTLYAAREMLRPTGEGRRDNRLRGRGRRAAGRAAVGSAFAAVKVAAPVSLPRVMVSAGVPQLRARLPNGVSIELVCAGTDRRLMSRLLEDLARLGCSGSMGS